MRIVLALIMATCMVTPAAAQQSTAPDTSIAAVVARAQLDGKLAGEAQGAWFGRSLAIGALSGLIGTGVTWAIAANSNPELPAEQKLMIASRSQEYRQIFERSFKQTVRSKRSKSAVLGGLTGTAAFVALVLANSGGQ